MGQNNKNFLVLMLFFTFSSSFIPSSLPSVLPFFLHSSSVSVIFQLIILTFHFLSILILNLHFLYFFSLLIYTFLLFCVTPCLIYSFIVSSQCCIHLTLIYRPIHLVLLLERGRCAP
jgi:hypothetical protein